MHKRILIIQNPGKISRFYLEGMINALQRLGAEHLVFELDTLNQVSPAELPGFTQHFAEEIKKAEISLVVSYACHGTFNFTPVNDGHGKSLSLFNALGIPHCMIWTDHPQWFGDRIALSDAAQERLKHPGNFHFLKSEPAARELHEVLGWQNCHMLPMAEDAGILKPVTPRPCPEFDLVAINGGCGSYPGKLKPFICQDDPDYLEMQQIVAAGLPAGVAERIEPVRPATVAKDEVGKWARDWVEMCTKKNVDPSRHLEPLRAKYSKVDKILRRSPHVYFDCTRIMWDLWNWQRPFYQDFLARHCSMRVFGAPGGDDTQWIDYQDQPAVYAKGRVAINIPQGPDIEGLTHKPFQIAACGVPMVHMRRVGLEECFQPGRDCETFLTPREAREAVGRILSDPTYAQRLSDNARERIVRDHTWDNRLRRMSAICEKT